jgi:hypothetical protein
MYYTALSFKTAPKLPGIYKIIYKDEEEYIGATSNLRLRFTYYHRFCNSPQWRLSLCKQNILNQTFSLKEVFQMTMFLFEYEVLETFDIGVASSILAEAERYYFKTYAPSLNQMLPGYPSSL